LQERKKIIIIIKLDEATGILRMLLARKCTHV